MRLGTKLNLLVVALVFASALGVGTVATIFSNRIEMSSIESPLRTVDAVGRGESSQALANVMNVLQSDNVDATVDVVSPGAKPTSLLSSSMPLTQFPSLSDAHNALESLRRSQDLPNAVYTSVDIGAGQYVVVLVSSEVALRHEHELELAVVVVSLVLSLLFIVLSRRILKNDVQALEELESYASEVMSGNLESVPPKERGSNEVRRLRDEFAQMVVTLQARIRREVMAVKAMQQFVGDASHELRTPLTVIKGTNDLLLNASNLSSPDLEKLSTSAKEIARMDRLISDLLYLAKMGEANNVSFETVNLSSVVEEELDRFGPFLGVRTITSTLAPNVLITANEQYIRRIISNALSNVVRYTQEGDHLSLEVSRSIGDVILIIEDGGPGLPRYDEAPTRFERFDSARSREQGGAGLGLSIMFDAARLLGGEMTMSQSDLGGLKLSFRFVAA